MPSRASRPSRTSSSPTDLAKIAVVRLYGLGNFILALPLIDALVQRYPRAEVALLVDPRCAGIARLTSGARRIVLLDKEFDAAAWFAAERPDLTLFAFPCADARLVQAAAKHGRTVCHHVGDNAGFAAIALTSDPTRHEVEHNLDLLRAIGVKVDSSSPSISPPRAGVAEAKRLLREAGVKRPFAAMHPGCHDDLTIKRWPSAYYAELADRLDRDGFDVVLVGGPGEESLAPPVLEAARSHPIDLIGKTTLAGVCGLLQQAKLMVANDSGLMHLAAAVGTPTVGIYGPTSWLKNTPLVEPHAEVRRPVSCSPCYAPGKPLKPCRAWCLEMTTPAMVHDAIAAMRAGRRWESPPLAQPLLSVVAPTCNRAGKLRDLLSSLGRQTYPRNRWELIVIDNNSRDDTAAVARSFPGARVAFYAERQSSYAARNHGVGVARGEVLAFIDDDCLADPDWLANGAQWFEHPAIGGVAGAVRAAADDSDIARWQARRGALALHPDVETSQFPAVPTANVFYRRAVFDQIGPFAEDMVSGGDYEFAWRMTAGGRWRFRADATAGVEHRHRQNLRALCRVYFRYGYGHVDLFRRHPQALQARDGDPRAAARAWARLARQAWRFAWQGVSPAAAPGLVPTAPADFARALGGREARAVVYASTRTEGTPVAAMLRAAGADVRALPLPPSLEFLETAMDAAAALGLSELYLYGAGQHTLRLARLRSFPSLQARGVIDDRATPGAALAGLPVVTLAEARRRGCRSILVSTDAFEHVLLPRLQPLTAEGVAVLGLYDDAALERYGRRVGGQSPVAAKTALLVSDMDLASARLAALARGLGATVRLDETAQSQYADDFLEWLSHLCLRAGRLAGSARFGRLIL